MVLELFHTSEGLLHICHCYYIKIRNINIIEKQIIIYNTKETY